jgi:hypothetical protein
MTRKTWSVAVVGLAALAICLLPSFMAVAQEKAPAATPPPAAKEVTLTGKLTDLHCFMAGCPATEKDPVKCAKECIEKGVPAVLEVEKGIVILGKGMEGGAKLFAPLAGQQVEVKGKVYEKAGVKYMDVVEAKKAGEKAPEKAPAKTEIKPDKTDKPATPAKPSAPAKPGNDKPKPPAPEKKP